jgi:argininosuccinate synthase
VRFELTYYALNPRIKVFAPWKNKEFLDRFKGRTDLLNYAEENGIPVKATLKKPYSEDDNLMHISHEAGILEDPGFRAGRDIISRIKLPQDAPDRETHISIRFKDGTGRGHQYG